MFVYIAGLSFFFLPYRFRGLGERGGMVLLHVNDPPFFTTPTGDTRILNEPSTSVVFVDLLKPKKLLLFLAFLSASIVNEETRVWEGATTSPQHVTKLLPGGPWVIFERTLKVVCFQCYCYEYINAI